MIGAAFVGQRARTGKLPTTVESAHKNQSRQTTTDGNTGALGAK